MGRTAGGRVRQRSADQELVELHSDRRVHTYGLGLGADHLAGGHVSAFGGAKHLSSSWGGPTLAGAWVVHFAITIGALLVVSLALALAHEAREDRSPTGRTPQNSGGVLGREVAGGFVKGSDMQESRTNLVSLTGSADCRPGCGHPGCSPGNRSIRLRPPRSGCRADTRARRPGVGGDGLRGRRLLLLPNGSRVT